MQSESLRTLVRLRRQLVTDQTRQKNRIKSLLLFLGEKVPEEVDERRWSNKYIQSLRNLSFKYPETRMTLDELLNGLSSIRNQIASIVKQLKKYVKENEEVKTIIDIKRFKKLDELSAYVGLSPALYSSADKEKTLGLSKQKNKYIRNFLIESTWIAIRKDEALQMAYGKLCRRMDSRKAIIRMAKKLLSRIRYVWINQQSYVLSVVE